MKFDAKTIVILVLLAFGGIFFTKWYFTSSGYKGEIKDLENKNKQIEKSRDSLKVVNKGLRDIYKMYEDTIQVRNKQITEFEGKLYILKWDLKKSNDKLSGYQKELQKTKDRIDSLSNNPANRDGDDLINSLKEKLKQKYEKDIYYIIGIIIQYGIQSS